MLTDTDAFEHAMVAADAMWRSAKDEPRREQLFGEYLEAARAFVDAPPRTLADAVAKLRYAAREDGGGRYSEPDDLRAVQQALRFLEGGAA